MEIGKTLPTTAMETEARIMQVLPLLLDGFRVRNIVRAQRKQDFGPDITATVRFGSVERILLIEVKQIGEPRMAMQAISQLQLYAKTVNNSYPVLAAPYLTERSRALCREFDVGYLDLVGNVYLRFGSVLVDRMVPGALRMERKAVRSLSAPKASRIVRRLLAEPKRVFRVTELARVSGASAAESYKVASLLEMKGFVRRNARREILLAKPGELLDTWASAVEFNKNPTVPTYSLERSPEAIMRRIAKTAKANNKAYALTRFAGASLVVPGTRFYDVACYVSGEVGFWMKSLDLKEVDSGSNLLLIFPREDSVFSEQQSIDNLQVVSNLQLYADLWGMPGRGRELGEMLRKKKIGF